MQDAYDPILDWSTEGRAALLAERGQEICLLLDYAFTEFLDREDARLSQYFGKASDPVAKAVEWSANAFATRNIDPAKLHPESRSFRLFTEVEFWLAQKVGTRAYQTIRNRRPPPVDDTPAEPPRRASDRHLERLAAGCRQLVRRTTPQLLTWWLVGTQRFRRACFEWEEDTLDTPDGLSPKQRSFATADALWRFLCLHLELLEDVPATNSSLFSPAPPTFPYRPKDAEIARTMELRVKQFRERRRAEIRELVRRCLSVAERPLKKSDEIDRSLDTSLARESLLNSLFHHYSLDDPDAASRVKALPRGLA